MKSVMAGNTIRRQDTVVLVACGIQPAAAHPSRARHLAWFARGARLKIVRGQNTSDALDFSAYQLAAARTGALRATDHPIVYPTLGLAELLAFTNLSDQQPAGEGLAAVSSLGSR
jgi:hypothetical protein